MINKITFAQMQSFINFVVDNTMKYGWGYKDILIDYCLSYYYGEQRFDTDDIEEIYDNNKFVLTRDIAQETDEIDGEQFYIIESAICNEIDKRERYEAASKVLKGVDSTLSILINKIIDITDNLGDISNKISMDELNDAIKSIAKIKGNMSADKIVKALIKNGAIPTKDNGSRNMDVPKNKIEVTSTENS